MRKLLLAMMFLWIAGGLFAQEASLKEELTKGSMALRMNQGKLEGPGAEFLLREARGSQFVLVGEDHGLAEVPQFCGALFGELRTSGFDNLAVEAGPETVRRLEKFSREKDPVEALRKFDQQYSFSLPFYNWKEEAVMATSLAASGMHVWGLDQEFILSPSFHFQRLMELAPTESAKKLAAEYLERSVAADKKMVAEKNPGVVFMVSATGEDFQKLSAAFPDPKSEAARIIRELQVSWEIYAKNFQGKGMESNLQRSALMKKHFHEYYDLAKSKKTVFKFGAFHAMRGRSLIGVHDLGNHVSELAEGLGSHSFHILTIVVRGAVNAYRPFTADPNDKTKPYDVVKEFDMADVKPFVEAAPAADWAVIDLRPLRGKISKFGPLDRGLEQLLWGYDAVVLIPEGHADPLLN